MEQVICRVYGPDTLIASRRVGDMREEGLVERKLALDDQDRQTDARRHAGSPIQARLRELLQITFFSVVVSQESRLSVEGGNQTKFIRYRIRHFMDFPLSTNNI